MSDSLDQIFVNAKQWILSLLTGLPIWAIPIVSSLINIAALLGVFLTIFALISVLERKILGRMQNRYGPNRVGPFGLFQPVADGIKMLIKEDVVPARADKGVHFLAPILVAAAAILAVMLLACALFPTARKRLDDAPIPSPGTPDFGELSRTGEG